MCSYGYMLLVGKFNFLVVLVIAAKIFFFQCAEVMQSLQARLHRYFSRCLGLNYFDVLWMFCLSFGTVNEAVSGCYSSAT